MANRPTGRAPREPPSYAGALGPPPVEPKARFSTRLPADVKRALLIRAAETSVTVEDLTERAIRALLNMPKGRS